MSNINTQLILETIITGIIWGFMFYTIRKGLNPRNFITNPAEKRESFYWDGVYGGFAIGLGFLLKKILMNFIDKLI